MCLGFHHCTHNFRTHHSKQNENNTEYFRHQYQATHKANEYFGILEQLLVSDNIEHRASNSINKSANLKKITKCNMNPIMISPPKAASTSIQMSTLQRALAILGLIFAAIISSHLFPCIANILFQEPDLDPTTGQKFQRKCFIPMIASIFAIIKQSTISWCIDCTSILMTKMPPAVTEYAKMSLFAFAFFVPALAILFAIVVGMSANTNGAAAILARQGPRRRARKKKAILSSEFPMQLSRKSAPKQMLLCFPFLFLFMATMISIAKSRQWIMLGLVSGATPVLLMTLAWLSVSNAEICATEYYFDPANMHQNNDDESTSCTIDDQVGALTEFSDEKILCK